MPPADMSEVKKMLDRFKNSGIKVAQNGEPTSEIHWAIPPEEVEKELERAETENEQK